MAQSGRKKAGESRPIKIYTDGGCLSNPGPGGYGVVMLYGKHRRELSCGFRLTTNNRMELWACIAGLQVLNRKCRVIVHSDSRYVVNGMSKGWVRRWRSNGWMRSEIEPVENFDLWQQLMDLADNHNTTFKWVKGHAFNRENNRCDYLARRAASGRQKMCIDEAYEAGETTMRLEKPKNNADKTTEKKLNK